MYVCMYFMHVCMYFTHVCMYLTHVCMYRWQLRLAFHMIMCSQEAFMAKRRVKGLFGHGVGAGAGATA